MLPGAKAITLGSMILCLSVSCKSGDHVSQQAVTTAVKAVAPDVSASVKNGVVALSGTTPDQATKSSLDSNLKNMKGVRSVVDSTTEKIASSPLPPPPPPPSAVPYHMNCPDTVAERDIDTAFRVAHIQGVHAEVKNEVVILTGKAAKKDMQMILAIAGEPHPKKVINRIAVK